MSISSCNRRRHAIIPNKRNYHYRLSLNSSDHLIAHLECKYIKQQRTEHKTSLMYILCWQQQITDYNILGIHYIRTERNKENPNKNGFCNMLSKSHFWLHLDSLFIIITLKLYYHKEWSKFEIDEIYFTYQFNFLYQAVLSSQGSYIKKPYITE